MIFRITLKLIMKISRLLAEFFYFIICVVISFLIFKMQFSKALYDNANNSTLSSALRSGLYRDCIVSSIGLTVPLVIYLALDNLQVSSSSSRYFASRWISVMGYVLPNILILTNVCNTGDTQLYWSLSHIQAYILITSSFSYLTNYGKPIWTSFRTTPIVGFAVL